MNLIFKILSFSLLLLQGNCNLIFKCTGMVSGDSVVLNENDELVCSCSDNVNQHSRLSFTINYYRIRPTYEPWRDDNDIIYEKSYDNKTITLKKNKLYYKDQGWYTCTNEEYHYDTDIYIWVKTKEHFFTTHEVLRTTIFRSFKQIFVPCVPTSPCYDVKLFKGSEELKINNTNGVKFDPREGFTIRNPSYIYAPINLTCSITMYGRTESILYPFTKFDDE